MPVLQSTPRRSVAKQAAVARRLIAQSTIAPHILATTMQYESDKEVIRMQVMEPAYIGALVLQANEIFYLFASKFQGRYYVVTECPEGGYKCSSTDTVVRYRCIEAVKAYQASFKK